VNSFERGMYVCKVFHEMAMSGRGRRDVVRPLDPVRQLRMNKWPVGRRQATAQRFDVRTSKVAGSSPASEVVRREASPDGLDDQPVDFP
jgi:hypothetical protein